MIILFIYEIRRYEINKLDQYQTRFETNWFQRKCAVQLMNSIGQNITDV